MNLRSTLIADRQTAKAVQPRHGARDDPAGAAQPAAVGAPALGELRRDPALGELVAVRLGIVGTVAWTARGLPDRPTRASAQRRHGVDQGQQLRDVMPVGGGQRRDERNPLRVGENMMFRPGFAAIGRVRSSFFPHAPRGARHCPRRRGPGPVGGAAATRRATRDAAASTPARCQRRRRRQHVVPDPQPSSWGNMFQGMPLRRTNKMPVSTARSAIGLRPAYRRLRARRFGSNGSIRSHKASSMKRLGQA